MSKLARTTRIGSWPWRAAALGPLLALALLAGPALLGAQEPAAPAPETPPPAAEETRTATAAPEAPQPAPEPPEPEAVEPEAVEPEVEEAAPAAPAEPKRLRRSDAQVIFGSPLTVEADEVSKDVTVFGGPLTIEGKVIGDAASIGGPVVVSGEVTGDLVAVGGPISLRPGARIMGDVISVGGAVDRDEDAEVMGTVVDAVPSFSFGNFPAWGKWTGARHVDIHFSPWDRVFGLAWQIFGLLVFALLLCLVLFAARGPVERVERRIAAEPWKAGLAGLAAALLFLPLLFAVVLILIISIIGIPFCLLIPFALLAAALFALLGYTAVAYRIGRFLEHRFDWTIASPILAMLLGLAAIQVWGLVGTALDFGWGPLRVFSAMLTFFGCLLSFIACLVGLGGVLLTRFGTADDWSGGRGAAALPPVPDAGGGAEGGDWDVHEVDAPQADAGDADVAGGSPERTWEPDEDDPRQ